MRWILAALYGLSSAAPAPAQEIVAVLSSDLAPFREALSGMEEELGTAVRAVVLQDGTAFGRESATLFVSFGSKAAIQEYPPSSTLVYCMAPGLLDEGIPHAGRKIKVQMSPPASTIVGRIRELQPGLRRLGVVWNSAAIGEEIEEGRQTSRLLHIELVEMRPERPGDLPRALRESGRHLDAIWLPPDPLLVSEATFAVLRDYSRGNGVPFYAPTAGLVDKGATAAVVSDFREVGRTAGRVVRDVRSGADVPAHVHPRTNRIHLNQDAATAAGLSVPAGVQRQVQRSGS